MEGDCQKGSWQEGSGLIESVGKWIEVNRHEVGGILDQGLASAFQSRMPLVEHRVGHFLAGSGISCLCVFRGLGFSV